MKKKHPKVNSFRAIDTALSLGFTLVIPQLGGLAIGLFLDHKLQTKPILTIVFLTTGLVLGIAAMIRQVKQNF
ncbi:hypothetical protein CO015_05385 [candidate division WWE3 bacterium CG_4_8_14_3_um_filter_42_11]|uniref:F0F1 ATP synthase subunit n=2 Tax=Katanobacteria TaxID=422282 RepID=A0A2M7TBI5_UNCKA|nr:MAG: hypothetical protein COY34_02800 [candidate division WWE3 bacterium CG_4_10_14_0_2_um_filter_42_8]PJC68071.1 MAG: hypothetical protein CO015_05385 [candidate division WWE3 bacterium CG_4_8_14_3_um_filter_42_11]